MKMTVLVSWARVSRISPETEPGKVESLVGGALHELDEHVGGELVGLIAGGDADDGEVFFHAKRRGCGRRSAGFFLRDSR